MGSFTIPLCEVIEMEGEEHIGLDEYPIYDESHRTVLNKKIIDHYYNHEIGQETISMFRLAMKRKMNEIMPAFNQQYMLSQIELDALSTMSVESNSTNTGNTASTNTGTSNTTTEGDTSSKSDAKSRAVASSFPQNSLQANSEYATGAQDNISESTASGNSAETQESTQNETQAIEQTGNAVNLMKGYQGHQPELIFAARQTIVNIDLEIINALDTLFIGLYSTSAEYSAARTHYVPYYRFW